MKLRLVLDVTYDPHGVPERDLSTLLEWVAQHAANVGMLTGDLEAEVDEWSARVERVQT